MSISRLLCIHLLLLVLLPGLSPADDLLERGRYLVEGIVACGNCHTPKTDEGLPDRDMQFAGAFVIEEPVFRAYAPNITMDRETGIGAWSDEDIIRSIREGIRPDGTLIGPPMPSLLYRGISDRDVRAIVAYMRTVKPIRNTVPRSEYRIPLPSAWGPPVDYVPEVSRENRIAYGAYLAGPLGHCIECHTPLVNGKPDFSRIGAGGNVYHGIFGLDITAVASNITPHPAMGIGGWTSDQIKAAVTRGIRPDGNRLAPVMGFSYYEKITDEDLDALVTYLRTLPSQPAD